MLCVVVSFVVALVRHQSGVAVDGLCYEWYDHDGQFTVSVVGMLVLVTHMRMVGVCWMRMVCMMVLRVLMPNVVVRMHRVGKRRVVAGMLMRGVVVFVMFMMFMSSVRIGLRLMMTRMRMLGPPVSRVMMLVMTRVMMPGPVVLCVMMLMMSVATMMVLVAGAGHREMVDRVVP